MKRILALIGAMTIFTSVAAEASPIYTATKEEIVTGGVTLKQEQRFYGDYALNINCLTADLKNKNLKLELLKHSGGSDKTATVKDLAKGEEKTVAAINGDFFSAYKGDQNFSLGIEVKDSELLQSHINPDMAAGFLSDNVLSFSYLTFEGEVETPDGKKMPIAHINKPTDYYGAVLMYTPHFNGGISPFLPEGITVVTAEDDVVTAKGVSLGGTVKIPDNGYILVIDDNMTPFLDIGFNVGDKVKTKIEFSPSIENVETAFGGGTLLLKNGEKTEITHNVAGNNPRSAIGTNEDGSVVYFITVDGRQNISRGVTLDTLSQICLDMGAVNAINLDGGGSTAMVGKTLENNELHNFNTPTENRKVINAIAVTSDAASGQAAGFFINAEKECVLSGDGVSLSLTAYDKNFNRASKIPGKVRLELASGKGSIKNNVFYPTGGEKAEIAVYYDGKKTDSVSIDVIERVSGIIAPEKIKLDKGKTFEGKGKIKVFDENGKTAVVSNLTLLYPKFDAKHISLDTDGSVTAIKEGASEIKLIHGDASRSIEVICGDYEIDSEKVRVSDSLNRENGDGYSIDFFASSQMTTFFDRIAYVKAMDTLKKSDAAVILGGEKPSDLTDKEVPIIKTDSSREEVHFNSKIITLSQKSGKFDRGEEWKKFAESVKNTNEDNLFIVSDLPIGFVADIDRQAFHTILSDAAKEKNVFVINSGSENFCRIADKIRYITIADIRDEDDLASAIKNTCYLSFKVTDSNVTYSFKNLF